VPRLLTTKLYIPAVQDQTFSRARLITLLNRGLTCRLVLLSAPPGFGKTTLLSTWRADLEAQDMDMSWVSLDRGDNDPAVFWHYCIAAIEEKHPGAGTLALSLLRSGGTVQVEAVVSELINGLMEFDRHVVLVLDDYHLIESPKVHRSVEFLLQRMPPHLHLVIATRVDPPLPLARFRASGQLVELRGPDLRCTSEEVGQFFRQVMGRPLTDQEVISVEGYTEGWLAAMRLAALSTAVPDWSKRESLRSSHRHVFDYLAEEVLHQQSDEVQEFLIQTSILERMNAALCSAVTNRVRTSALMANLEASNLFLMPLDHEHTWFRYHHLFLEFLRSRLDEEYPDLVPTLHRRAAEWYERNGLAHLAVDHLFQAKEYDHAAILMEELSPGMLTSGMEFSKVLAWLEQVPEPVLVMSPFLLVAYAWALVVAHRLPEVDEYLILADRLLERTPAITTEEKDIRGLVIALRSHLLRVRGDFDASVELSARALELLSPHNLFQRGLVAGNLGTVYMLTGNLTKAAETLAMAAELRRTSGNSHGALVLTVRLAQVRSFQGRLREAVNIYQTVIKEATAFYGRLPLAAGSAYIGLGDILREWNQLDEAEEHIRTGIALSQDYQPEAAAAGLSLLAACYSARGRWAEAKQEADRAVDLVPRVILIPVMPSVGTIRARVYLSNDDTSVAEELVAGGGLKPEDDMTKHTEAKYLVLAEMLVIRQQFELAADLAERICLVTKQEGRHAGEIRALVLLARSLDGLGRHSQALDAIRSAVAVGAPEQFMRVFLDAGPVITNLLRHVEADCANPAYVRKLLEASSSSDATAKAGAVAPSRLATPTPKSSIEVMGPLSARELEVLQMVSQGATNEAIARKLFIGMGTVKTHLINIYNKLEVHSRTQAVARARELGMIS